jgi:prevent-host-death family protein
VEISVRELKNRLSECLRLARAGEDVVVTAHGKPVVRLIAVAETAPDAEAAFVAELAALPWVRPGKGGPIKGSAAPMAPSSGGKPLSEVLMEDRE